MSELDPKVKEELVKQVQEIANGKAEIGVGGSAVSSTAVAPNAKVESDKQEKQDQVVVIPAPVQTESIESEPVKTEPVVDQPVVEPVEEQQVPVVQHPIVGQPKIEPIQTNPEPIVQPKPAPVVVQPASVQPQETPIKVSPPMTQQPIMQPVYQQPTHVKKDDSKVDPMMVLVFIVVLVLGGLFMMNKFGGNFNLGNRQHDQFPQQHQQYPQQQQQQQQHQQYPQQPYQNFNNFQNGPYEQMPQEFQGPHLDQQFRPPVQPYPQGPNSLSINDIKTYLEPWIDRKLSTLERRVDRLDHRTWLLAVANNENATISRRVAERVNASDLGRKYITFDANWNLSKMPEFIRLTSEQRYNLLEEVDDANYQREYQYEYDYNSHSYRQIQRRNYSYVQPQSYQSYCSPGISYQSSSCQPNYNSCNSQYVCRPGRVFNWNVCR